MQGLLTLATFTEAYIECALWCGVLDCEEDSSELSLTDECRERMAQDCASFYDANCMLFGACRKSNASLLAGHDFWLTRNRHGSGFWDGDWREPEASLLTKAAHVYGEVNLCLSQDGKVEEM